MNITHTLAATGTGFAIQALTAFASPLNAPTLSSRVSTAPECQKDMSDPFDFGVRSPRGMDKGKCINFKYKPIVVLNTAEIAQHRIPSLANHITIANVAHSNTQTERFYIANVPFASAYEARLLLEHFIVGSGTPFTIDPGHTMVRVFFTQDVQVFEQRAGNTDLKYTTRELIFAAHSSDQFVPSVDLITRLMDGSFALTGAAFTFPGKFQRPNAPLENLVEQWKLSLSPLEVSEFVKRYIQKANRDAAKKPYLLTDSNCVTEIFQIFDRMLTYSNSQLAKISGAREGEWIPTEAPRAFEARGLINTNSKMHNVNSEL